MYKQYFRKYYLLPAKYYIKSLVFHVGGRISLQELRHYVICIVFSTLKGFKDVFLFSVVKVQRLRSFVFCTWYTFKVGNITAVVKLKISFIKMCSQDFNTECILFELNRFKCHILCNTALSELSLLTYTFSL